LAGLCQLDYFESQRLALPRQITPLQAWDAINSEPLPGMRQEFWLHDQISALFGVKKIGEFFPSRL
jgi:hypothetical protein